MELFNEENLKHLDKRTKKIVFGYMRKTQRALFSTHRQKNAYHTIPRVISLICLSFIDDYFMINCGTFEWCIDGELFEQIMLVAQYRIKFDSEIFSIGKLPFSLLFESCS